MTKALECQDFLADLTVAFARTTQAVVVEGLDRMAREMARDWPVAGRRWGHPGRVDALLALTRRFVGEPVELIDRGYGLTARLVELHWEFAHRVLEVIESHQVTDEATDEATRDAARVPQSRPEVDEDQGADYGPKDRVVVPFRAAGAPR